MENEKTKWKELSIFQKTCTILTVVLIVAIIVQICVMIAIKNKTDDTKNKNDEIESQLPESPSSGESFEVLYTEVINKI